MATADPNLSTCPLCKGECACGLVRAAVTAHAAPRGRAAEIGRWLAALAATVGIVLGGGQLAATVADATGVGAARLIGPLLAVVWLALLRWDRHRGRVTR